MVYAVENHTPSRHSQHRIEEGKTKREIREFTEAHHTTLNGKLITTVQICLRCGRKFQLNEG